MWINLVFGDLREYALKNKKCILSFILDFDQLESHYISSWLSKDPFVTKVSFFVQCSKMQLITLKKFNIKTCFIQFLWFFRLKCWFKGQIISRIHLSLPNAYKLMCFDRNINGNRDVKFFGCDYWSLHWRKNLTLAS